MAAFSNWMEDAIINFFLRNNADTISAPNPIYLALFTADPTDTGSFTNEVTNTPNSYARQTITFDDPAASGNANETQNSADVTFTDMPGVTVTHFAITDSGTYQSGNVLFHGSLSASVSPSAGDTVTLSAGNLTIGLD